APSNYRCVAGSTFGGQSGVDQTGGDANWDDAGQINWLNGWKGGNRGVMHATRPDIGLGQERMASIKDGTSNTLMVGEYATMTQLDRRSFWAYAYTSYNESDVTIGQSRTLLPDFILCGNTPPGNTNQCKRAWGSFHPGGTIQFVMCDGSVRGIPQTIDTNFVFPALGSIAGGEVLPYDF